jgi:Ca-activated chloride channel homolog
MKFSRHLICVSLMLFFLFSIGYSQNTNSAIEVRANVLIVDSEGKDVDDIKQEDLKIFEDGVEQKITYFSKKEPVTNVGFIIDNTGSMRTQLEKIIKVGTSIVNSLGKQDEAFIVRFVNTEKTTILTDWTSDKSILNRSINNMFIEGGQSALIDAINLGWLKISYREEKDKTKKYALVLISDCEERESVSDMAQVLSNIQNAGVQVHVVALTQNLDFDSNNSVVIVSGKPKKKKTKEEKEREKNPRKAAENFAENLAFQTGGRVFILNEKSKTTVDDILKGLTDELRSQYVVRYVSTNQDRKKTERKLTVQVSDGENGEKHSATIRENVIVPKN